MEYNVKFVFLAAFVLCLLNITESRHIPNDKTNDAVVSMIEELTELKEIVVSLKRRVQDLEQDHNLTSAWNKLHEDFKGKRTKRAPRRKRIPEVAFHATLTKSTLTGKDKVPIKYNNVHTNIGKYYNSVTGIFTAPIRGIYVFNTNIVAAEGQYVEACIQVGTAVKASAISDHRHKLNIWDQGSAQAVLVLNPGNKVSVSIQWPHGDHVIYGMGRTSFSGHLVRALGLANRRGYPYVG